MTDLELIFSMLGEASTTEIVKVQNPKGFLQNHKVAKQGGAIAGKARKELENKTGKSIVSAKNYLAVKETKTIKKINKKDRLLLSQRSKNLAIFRSVLLHKLRELHKLRYR